MLLTSFLCNSIISVEAGMYAMNILTKISTVHWNLVALKLLFKSALVTLENTFSTTQTAHLSICSPTITWVYNGSVQFCSRTKHLPGYTMDESNFVQAMQAFHIYIYIYMYDTCSPQLFVNLFSFFFLFKTGLENSICTGLQGARQKVQLKNTH